MEEEEEDWVVEEAEIYVCVCGAEDRGLQRETAGPIIDGTLPGQRHPQSPAGPSAWSFLALIKWLHFASLFSTREQRLIPLPKAMKGRKESSVVDFGVGESAAVVVVTKAAALSEEMFFKEAPTSSRKAARDSFPFLFFQQGEKNVNKKDCRIK